MGSIVYTSDNIPVCGNSQGHFLRMEFSTQTINVWSADTLSATGGLPSVSFTSSLTSVADFPFAAPEISTEMSPEVGLFSLGSLSIQASNESISGVRIYSYLRSINEDTETVHVRFSYKTSLTGDWIYKYWGVVNYQSIEVQCSDLNDPDTYNIRFDVTNIMELLSHRDIRQFAEDKCRHQLNDYTANNKWTTIVGTNWRGYSAGKYLLTRWFLNNDYENPNNSVGWLPSGSLPENSSQIPFRWYRLVDLFKKASEYLGLELPVNQGVSWTQTVTTLYGFNGGNDDTVMTYVNIDDLYYPVGVYVYFPPSYVYANVYGFFDETQHAEYSFYQYSNVLELIKGVCSSLGLIASVKINSTGSRYLSVTEAGWYNSSTSVVDAYYATEDNISSDIKFNPYYRKVSGIKVCSAVDSDVIRGNDGNDGIKVDCIFSTANHVLVNQNSVVNTTSNTYTTREDKRLLGSLWAAYSSATGSWDNNDGSSMVFDNLYTVCSIVPRTMFVGSTLSGSDYDYKVKSSNVDVDYGEYQGTYGGWPLNCVVYPAENGVSETFSEAVAMAIGHLYYSPKSVTLDQIGIYRTKSRSLSIKVSGINDVVDVGQRLRLIVEGNDSYWYVTKKTENFEDYVTSYELETREI